ncbi:hypothetical protein QN277_012438 [Acacia crassicarpa]|uniref:Uncharacterized protein n=1 Tax=Acacia crassicarpa TaxID=499986 RepID=A0AAE1TDE2_9FABA|nr:hypothetical protein QN277_012438 [Acacia crassicarpa]
MTLTSLMVRSIVGLFMTLIGEPVASISTLLYYSGLLPQNVVLTRLVRHDLLLHDNYLFRCIIDLLSLV